jgi:hypothetical protein
MRHTRTSFRFFRMPHSRLIINSQRKQTTLFYYREFFAFKTNLAFSIQMTRSKRMGKILAWREKKCRNIHNVGYLCSIKGRNQLVSDENSARWLEISINAITPQRGLKYSFGRSDSPLKASTSFPSLESLLGKSSIFLFPIRSHGSY